MVIGLTPQRLPLGGIEKKPEAQEVQAPDIEGARQRCIDNGGTWDPINKSCKFTGKKEEKPDTTLGVTKDVETGRISGIQKGGEQFFGGSPEEITAAVTKESLARELPVGGQAEADVERQRQALQTQGADLATSVGATPSDQILEQLKSQVVNDGLNYSFAFKSALPGLFPDIITGATAGAGLALIGGQLGPQALVPEEIVTVPTAAILGGIAGAVKGFYSDFMSELRQQQSAQIEGTVRTLSETKPTLNDIVNSQNANPENAIDNKEAFDNQMAFIDLAYEDLKGLTDGNLDAFLGDAGINQHKEFEVFYGLDGEKERLDFDMQLALSNPDPARIRPTAITIEDIKKRIESELS